jgi:hypothetical protein
VLTGDHADALTRGDRVACSNRGRDRLVFSAQAVRVLHHHDTPTGHEPGERDDPAPGRPHRLAGHGGQVHPAVSRGVRPGRSFERAHDPHRPADR